MRQVFAHGHDPLLFHTDFAACNRYTRGLEAAASVRCPAHLVLGSADQMTLPKGAKGVASALKASVHVLPAGHFLMHECPDGVLNALRTALNP
jgi:pimeloyl-ACP methyl ester carboxylesterase